MSNSYSEIYYSSTQKSILSGTDGFGVRTFTQGLPAALIEEIKSRNLFFYESGTKRPASAFDLIESPSLVKEYPATLGWFSAKHDEDIYYFAFRNIFLGRDYGWYLPIKEEGARSGNTFFHGLIFKNDYSPVVFQLFLRNNLEVFEPLDIANYPDNQNLRTLLIGDPTHLESKTIDPTFGTDFPPSSKLETSITHLLHAIESKKLLIIRESAGNAGPLLGSLFLALPKILQTRLNAVTNFHGFNPFNGFKITFINEFFTHDIPWNSPDFIVCDHLEQKYCDIENAAFTEFLVSELKAGNTKRIAEVNGYLDFMVSGYSEKVKLDYLLYAAHYLFHPVLSSVNISIDDVLLEVLDYELTPAFEAQLDNLVIESFRKAVSRQDFAGLRAYLRLIRTGKFDLPAEVRVEFSQSLFTYGFTAGLMNQYDDKEHVSEFISRNDVLNDFEMFFLGNDLEVDTREYFVLKWINEYPEIQGPLFTLSLTKFDHRKELVERCRHLMGEKEFGKFLIDHSLFLDWPPEIHLTLLRGDIVFLIKNAVNNTVDDSASLDDFSESIQNGARESAELVPYFDELMKAYLQVHESPTEFFGFIEDYVNMIREERASAESEFVLGRIFDLILTKYECGRDDSQLMELANALSVLKGTESIDLLKEKAVFISTTLSIAGTGKGLSDLSLPKSLDSLLICVGFLARSLTPQFWLQEGAVPKFLDWLKANVVLRNDGNSDQLLPLLTASMVILFQRWDMVDQEENGIDPWISAVEKIWDWRPKKESDKDKKVDTDRIKKARHTEIEIFKAIAEFLRELKAHDSKRFEIVLSSTEKIDKELFEFLKSELKGVKGFIKNLFRKRKKS